MITDTFPTHSRSIKWDCFVKSLAVIIISSVFFGLASPARCSIWDQVRECIDCVENKPSFSTIITELSLLVDRSSIVSDGKTLETISLAGGLIVLTQEGVRSYSTVGDSQLKREFEFEYLFREQKVCAQTSKRAMKIALDIIPDHDFFNHLKIGDFDYRTFVSRLQATLKDKLSQGQWGAEVVVLRPEVELLNAEIIDHVNENPPDILISTQFNADDNEGMYTFCGGHLSASELRSERQRARLIQALLTRKASMSLLFGSQCTLKIMKYFSVSPLKWQDASFKGTTAAVDLNTFSYLMLENDVDRMAEKIESLSRADSAVDSGSVCKAEDEEINFSTIKINGVGMRNTIHNGVFARVVFIPFASMKWVLSTVKKGEEQAWINNYTQAIYDAIWELSQS